MQEQAGVKKVPATYVDVKLMAHLTRIQCDKRGSTLTGNKSQKFCQAPMEHELVCVIHVFHSEINQRVWVFAVPQ